MLLASQEAIRGFSLDEHLNLGATPPEAIAPITSRGSHFVAVDYDATEEYVYYSDIRQGVIFRIHTNGTGQLMRN